MITRILRFSPINPTTNVIFVVDSSAVVLAEGSTLVVVAATTNVIIGVTLQLVDPFVNVSAEGLINSVVSEVACVAVLLASVTLSVTVFGVMVPVTLQLIQISLL